MKDGGKQILYICKSFFPPKNTIVTQFKAVVLFTYCILKYFKREVDQCGFLKADINDSL